MLHDPSHRPQPSVAEEIKLVLDKARGARVKLILKDIATVRYQPRRLWERATIAVEEAERFAK